MTIRVAPILTRLDQKAHRECLGLDDGFDVERVVIDVDASQVLSHLMLLELRRQLGGVARVHEQAVSGIEKLLGRPLCPADDLLVVVLPKEP